MKNLYISLDGTWEAYGKDESGCGISFEGAVPGCVHTDLIRAGVISDIYYRDNSKKTQWIEKQDFTYGKSFFAEEIYPDAYLEFQGLDTYCDVFLNGVKIGSGDDMFVVYSFPVDGVLKKGENRLEVKFRSPIKEVEGRPKLKGVFTTERLHTRRIQCTYGWDWVDRFVTMGIYRSVGIRFGISNRINSFYLFTKSITPYGAEVRLSVELENICPDNNELTVRVTDPEGKTVFERERRIIKPTLKENIYIANPKLWYPNGYGEQPLYTLSIKTHEEEKTLKFGIRTVTVLQIPDETGSPEEKLCRELQSKSHLTDCDFNDTTSSFTVLVNGVRILCKGANWVPCEPFPSAESPEKITRLLELGALSGVNMLRVWGGGIDEIPHFYEECTRLGILVTQDFFMACGEYPEREEWFIKALGREAEACALKLRNHTCLAWWTGDNENAVDGTDNITDFPGYLSATYGLEPAISRLDPERIFLPSSPYGGNKYSSATAGTTHISNFMGMVYRWVLDSDIQDFREKISSFAARFIVEQPTMGMPFKSTLNKFMTDEDIYGSDTSISEFHTKHNPDLGEVSVYSFFEQMTEKVFGKYESGEDRFLKMQMMQCEWIRQSAELTRRLKWFSSGIIYWMFNDCWPAANGWSIIDYYACPKPGYYAFRRGAKGLISSIDKKEGEYRVYLSNDTLTSAKAKGKLYVYDFNTARSVCEYDFDGAVEANSSALVFTVSASDLDKLLDRNSIIICDIESSLGCDRSHFLQNRYSDLNLTYGNVRVVEEDEDCVTVIADDFDICAIIDTPYLLDENAFLMKKGEIKKIKKLMKI